MSDKITIICKDGEKIEVDAETACYSEFLRDFVEGGNFEIPLENMTHAILEKIFTYCEHLKDHTPPEIEKPLRSTDMADLVDAWYADFINVDKDVLL